MSNRLQIFRERMAAFEGAANPQEAIESGYYVRAPGTLLAEKISARVALRPASSHLLIGGIGSGKTTQLLVASENLKEIGDIYPIYVDVSLHTDISKIVPGVLTAIAGVELSELLGDSQDSEIQYNINKIRKIAYGYSEEITVDKSLNSLNSLYSMLPTLSKEIKTINRPGIIPSKSVSVKTGLINNVSKLILPAAKKYGNLVLLFDGLDRLNDYKTFMDILNLDVKPLSNVNIGIVIVGSLSSLYQDNNDSIEYFLDYFYHQPFFDIENDNNADNFCKQILKNRSQDDFIEEDAIDLLVKFSGGVLRDLISLTQASIEETYISGDEKLNTQHVLIAINSFSKAQILGLTDSELGIMKQTLETGNFIPRTSEHIKLLTTRRILEYRYPKQRYAVHPAIAPIIEQIYAEN